MLDTYRFHAGQFSVPLNEIKFSGGDVAGFLQSQSTFDISRLLEENFRLLSFLDPQGRVECYGWLLNHNGQYSFLIPPALTEQTLIRLNKFLISEDVSISEPLMKTFYIIIGPEAENFKSATSFLGLMFDEISYLQAEKGHGLGFLKDEEIELWRGLTGWPSFDGSDYEHSLINNLRLFDLSLVLNKGCYPGQETVSKIATRRGAAYSPVLLELSKHAPAGDIISFDKKIGTSKGCYQWKGKYYLSANLLRDFRVEQMKIHFTLNETSYEGTVKYFPLISGKTEIKARELYYEASDHFKREELEQAEEKFRLAIKLNPTFGDA